MSRSILVADDAVFMRRLIRNVLRPKGYVVHEAVSGSDALAAFDELNPDLVILDVALPDMSGLVVLERLRAKCPQARVLLLTSTALPSDAAGAHAAVPFGCLLKPFRPAQLLDAVRSSLRPHSV